MGNLFKITAGIAHQFIAEHLKNLFWQIKDFGLKSGIHCTIFGCPRLNISIVKESSRLWSWFFIGPMSYSERGSKTAVFPVLHPKIAYSCNKSWASYTATWKSECKCLSEPQAVTCGSFPAFIAQSANNFLSGQCPHHTAKRVKQFLEAENIKIMKWPAQSPDLIPIENLWKIIGDKVMAKIPLYHTVEETERKWTKITTEQCESIVMSCGHKCIWFLPPFFISWTQDVHKRIFLPNTIHKCVQICASKL